MLLTKFWKNKVENIGFGFFLKLRHVIVSRQITDSPPPQQDASNSISGRTGLCVYLSYTIYSFPSQHRPPPLLPPCQKNNQHATRAYSSRSTQ